VTLVRPADSVASALLARLDPSLGAAAWRRGDRTVVGVVPEEIVTADGVAALDALDQLGPGTWVGWCSFELGHAIEAIDPRGASSERAAVPDLAFARFGAHAVISDDGAVVLDGDAPARRLLERAVAEPPPPPPTAPGDARGRWSSSLDRPAFEARVDAIVELLRAGECYQVNLTRRLTRAGRTDPAALYASLVAAHDAPHLGMLRLDLSPTAVRPTDGSPPSEVAVVCASPELFLRRAGRSVETRPIKGTASDADVLRRSAKDHAENLMIVDLARNDLGRVCEPGSIGVPARFEVESHPGLHHLVSTVRGTLRDDVGLGALIAATFPPASVTGAPKPRVLQAIEELEPVRRGVYCGAFGWVDTERDEAELAVAIRTFTVFPDRTELGVGAGIVADSSPEAEWHETELKARRLLAIADAVHAVDPSADALASPIRAGR
jgi:para-aminobenzoate synthetase component 1